MDGVWPLPAFTNKVLLAHGHARWLPHCLRKLLLKADQLQESPRGPQTRLALRRSADPVWGRFLHGEQPENRPQYQQGAKVWHMQNPRGHSPAHHPHHRPVRTTTVVAGLHPAAPALRAPLTQVPRLDPGSQPLSITHPHPHGASGQSWSRPHLCPLPGVKGQAASMQQCPSRFPGHTPPRAA